MSPEQAFDFYLFLVILIIIGGTIHAHKPPNFRYRCWFGFHRYVYAGQRSGMVFNPNGRGVTGTMRTMYKCDSCGKHKKPENKDYS